MTELYLNEGLGNFLRGEKFAAKIAQKLFQVQAKPRVHRNIEGCFLPSALFQNPEWFMHVTHLQSGATSCVHVQYLQFKR